MATTSTNSFSHIMTTTSTNNFNRIMGTDKVNLYVRIPVQSHLEWRCILSVPVDKCQLYAVRPLKWLRFLGYALCGCEGTLSATPIGPAVEDDVKSIPQGSTLYYFIAGGPVRFVDPDAMQDRVSSSARTDRRVGFRNRLIKRDKTCIITDFDPILCQASHILPHSKGDGYIESVCRNRLPEEAPQAAHILSINDIRNGFLLNSNVHTLLGRSELAFIKTPNYGLKPDDIPSAFPPSVAGGHRLTLQHFAPLKPNVLAFIPHNTDARKPPDTEEWPPDFILDYAYVCAALERWGSESVDLISEAVREKYYGAGSNYNPGEHERSENKEEPTEEGAGGSDINKTDGHRMKRRSAGGGSGGRKASGLPTSQHKAQNRRSSPATKREKMMDVVFYLWSLSASEKIASKEKKAEAENRERVNAWLGDQVCDTDTQGAGPSISR